MEVGKKVHGHGDFNPASVYIVDYDSTNNNLLVRGTSAFGAHLVSDHNTNFQFSDLISAIQSTAQRQSIDLSKAGINLSKMSTAVDFCLIGFGVGSKDAKIVQTELEWFNPTAAMPLGACGPYPYYYQNTGNKSYMVYWPIQAYGDTPPTTSGAAWPSSTENQIGANGGTGFDFKSLITSVRQALTNTWSSPPAGTSGTGTVNPPTSVQNSIVYVHCDSGVNRTGAVVMSYLMMYGSNVSTLNLASAPSTPYTLNAATVAAKTISPVGNSPLQGVDWAVAEAYCNYNATASYQGNLDSNCVPLTS